MDTINGWASPLAYKQAEFIIKEFEGCRLKAYKCPAGIWTIGWGHTKNVHPLDTWTQEQADAVLRNDINDVMRYVDSRITVELNDNQLASLASLTYNIGNPAFCFSSLRRMLNAGNYAAVPAQILRWNKVKGKDNDGLTRRRKAEVDLWLSPVPTKSTSAPITKEA